jgi:hypothetical protein
VDEEMTALFNMILREPFVGIDMSNIDTICGDCSSMTFPVLSEGLLVESHFRMLSSQAAISSSHAVLIGELLEIQFTPAGAKMMGLDHSLEETSLSDASSLCHQPKL